MNVFVILLIMFTVNAILVIGSDLPSWIKPFAVLAFLFCSLLSFLMLLQFLGSPQLTQQLPQKMIVYGQIIDKENDSISLLMRDEASSDPPKYIKCPYSQMLHKALSQGAKAAGGGKPFKLTSKGSGKGEKGSGKGGKKGKGSGLAKGKNKGSSISLESISSILHSLPEPKLPEKTNED